MTTDNWHKILSTTLFFIACFAFWAFVYPEALSFQEQQQLFLFSADYLINSLSQMGGLADYIAEFIIQFYYYPVAGALLLALCFVLLQITTWLLIRAVRPQNSYYPLSFVPAIMLWAYMGDENVMLSFLVAIIISICATLFLLKISKYQIVAISLSFPILYWLVGPAMVICALVCAFYDRKKVALFALIYVVLIVFVARHFILTQHTLTDVLCGINYYRLRQIVPLMQHIIILTVTLVAYIPLILPQISKRGIVVGSYILVAIVGGVWISCNFDDAKYSIIKYDYLVRREKWNDIIALSKQNPIADPTACTAVNLALGMTGQLSNRMFEFPQCGSNALIAPFERTSFTCLPSAEALLRLGMVNSALRYFFDLQEAIVNCQKSGRLMRRMAECNIINGRYDVARKYLSWLKQSLFYSEWAARTEKLLGNEKAIDNHPLWGRIRKIRYQSDFFFNIYEIDKMFCILWQENSNNKMAYEYFVAQQLLTRNLNSFYSYSPLMLKQGYQELPRSYQEAMALIWSQGHSNWEGIPISVSDNVKCDLMTFASIYQNNKQDKQLKQKFGTTYWYYCLVQQPTTDSNTGATKIEQSR